MSAAARRGQTGFTLLEVLIALAIVAVALAATVRALGLSTTGTQAILERSLALQAARNHLAELHLRRTIPAPGIHQTPCAQGPLALVCESQARAADLAAAHPVTVRVRAREGGPVLAQLHGILTAPP